MLAFNDSELTMEVLRSKLAQTLSGLVAGKVEEALNAINTHNLKIAEEVKTAEETLAELDKAAEEETSAFAKLMWPDFRAKKVGEIDAIRAKTKDVPSPDVLSSAILSGLITRTISDLGITEVVPQVRKPRQGDGSFNNVWGSHFTHNGTNYMVANYRIISSSLKEAIGLKNDHQWVILKKNQEGKWYNAHTFEATSPSQVVRESRSFSAGRPLTQTNLDGFVWSSNLPQTVKDALMLNTEKLNTELSK